MQTDFRLLYKAVGYDFDSGLRKLSDMKEEEALDCYNFCWVNHQIHDDDKIEHIRSLFNEESDENYAYGNVFGNSKVFRWGAYEGV